LSVRLGAAGERQRVLVGERHGMHLPRVPRDFRDEAVLVLGASFESALAMKHLLHDSSPRE
jgi:hypothetical protein